MTFFRSAVAAIILSTLLVWPAAADIKVVASIKPIHSLVSGVMAGLGKPSLIVEGAGSPHTYALKPSRARALQDADVIFWIGHELEPFLEKPLESLGAKADIVALIDVPGLTRLPFREGGPGEEPDDHEEAEHEHHHGHGDSEFDPHVWLDPDNSKQMVRHILTILVSADPLNAAIYRTNAAAVLQRLDQLAAQMKARLAPVSKQPFVVFHDSYQYLETRFGLTAVGSVTVIPDILPGAERVGEIRRRVRELNAVCIFAEPQFTPKLVRVVAEAGAVKTSVLDPLGAGLPAGPDLYFSLMEKLADNVVGCLSPQRR